MQNVLKGKKELSVSGATSIYDREWQSAGLTGNPERERSKY